MLLFIYIRNEIENNKTLIIDLKFNYKHFLTIYYKNFAFYLVII